MNYQIDLRPDMSEKVRYNISDFPVYSRRGMLSWFPNYSAASHWHDDVEFLVVKSGRMDYNVNGEIVHLGPGDGIFVNARQLHYGFSTAKEECDHICVLLHPLRLCSSLRLEQQYLLPILGDERLSCHVLHPGVDWEREILEDLNRIYEYRCAPAAELQYQSCFYRIWWNLYTHLQSHGTPKQAAGRKLTALKAMLAYIEANYQNHITLDHICDAGNVSKTSCCSLFSRYVNQTPNVYLTNYRLGRGAELLTATDLSIGEISCEVGFSSPSYFTEMFRRSYDCSPSEYRRAARGKEQEL